MNQQLGVKDDRSLFEMLRRERETASLRSA